MTFVPTALGGRGAGWWVEVEEVVSVTTVEVKERRPLAPGEGEEVWVEFVAGRWIDFRCGMASALFNDVRPDWEAYLAKEEARKVKSAA
jgi:hypothetical protein